MKKVLVSILAAMFMTGTLTVLSGCNTVEGAGKDIEKGGEAIKNEANENKSY